MSFLPENYKVPTTNNYLKKFSIGENNIRILSSAIIGYEYWRKDKDGKPEPVRSEIPFKGIPQDAQFNEKTGKKDEPKHFWAFIVWNYSDEKIQICEITQATIQSAIVLLVKNKKWGDPKGYDITINRVGEGLLSEYSIVPSPHSELSQKIKDEFVNRKINLKAIYSSGDPFNDGQEEEINIDNIPFN